MRKGLIKCRAHATAQLAKIRFSWTFFKETSQERWGERRDSAMRRIQGSCFFSVEAIILVSVVGAMFHVL